MDSEVTAALVGVVTVGHARRVRMRVLRALLVFGNHVRVSS